MNLVLIFCLIFSISAVSIISIGIAHAIDVVYSKDGTNLRLLKVDEAVDIIFEVEFEDNRTGDGYAFYHVMDPPYITARQEQNFTSAEVPRTFRFSYTPNNIGSFDLTYGASSHKPTEEGSFYWGSIRDISVVDEYSKALDEGGRCKKPFPEFMLVLMPDYSTGICVKYDTAIFLKERGWH